MKFTIGTVSDFKSYEQDLTLIKSSLLYADEIELIGLTEYAVYKYLPTVFDGQKDLDELLKGLIPFLRSINIPNKEEILSKVEFAQSQLELFAPILRKKKRRTKQEIQAQYKVRQLIKDIQPQLSDLMNQLVEGPSSQELQSLINKNIVSVFDYHLQGMNYDEMTGSYVGSLLNTIYVDNTFPLFDDASSSFIGTLAKTKLLDIGKLDAEVLRHAGVATRILMTLPTLEGATFDELMDLKKQNEVPLARFRKAIYGFSEKISSLPWDKSFQYECIKLYETEVIPQVAEINELFTDTRTLKNLGKKVLADEEIRKKAGFVAGGLATAITTSSNLTGIFRNMLLAMSLATLSAEVASGFLKIVNMGVQAHSETTEAQKAGKANAMYYYYLATKM